MWWNQHQRLGLGDLTTRVELADRRRGSDGTLITGSGEREDENVQAATAARRAFSASLRSSAASPKSRTTGSSLLSVRLC
jgi:hypothetical protein